MSGDWDEHDVDGPESRRPEDDPFDWPSGRTESKPDEPGAPAERDPFDWPSGRTESQPDALGTPEERDPYAWRRPEPEPLPPVQSTRRSRDPLARLFPGLPHGVRVGLDWILTIAGAILIVLALKQWVVNPYRIPSSSMEPTLNCAKGPLSPGCLGDSSDRVLACRICLDFGPPSRGDIVVFNTPSEAALKCGEGGTFVKRVIGLPGETIRETDNGSIEIRGPTSKTWVPLKEPYISAQRRLADTTHFGESWKVPPGDYFMMGDNRAQSCDSRSWGSVPRNKLIGTVFFVYWPPDRIGFR